MQDLTEKTKPSKPDEDGCSDTAPFPIVIAQWDRNSREVVRVEIDEFCGSKIISVRSWYRDGSNLPPTKAGLSLSIRHAGRLADAFAAASDKLIELGLQGREGEP